MNRKKESILNTKVLWGDRNDNCNEEGSKKGKY